MVTNTIDDATKPVFWGSETSPRFLLPFYLFAAAKSGLVFFRHWVKKGRRNTADFSTMVLILFCMVCKCVTLACIETSPYSLVQMGRKSTTQDRATHWTRFLLPLPRKDRCNFVDHYWGRFWLGKGIAIWQRGGWIPFFWIMTHDFQYLGVKPSLLLTCLATGRGNGDLGGRSGPG